MAGTARAQDHPVTRALLENARSWSFFEAVRLLQALHPDAPRVGHQGPPAEEVVRFQPPLDFSFAAADVQDVRDTGEHYELECGFLSLYGAAAPLPACYTEELLYEDPEGLIRSFLDVFNHRLVSLLFRAWEKYRHTVQFQPDGTDAFTRRLRILCNLERSGDPLRLLAFGGLLLQTPLSEASLEHVLRACTKSPITVESSRVRWMPVPADQLTALGNANCVLGGQTPLGDSVRDAAGTFRVSIGPLPLSDYLEYLPGGERLAQLRALVDRLEPGELDYEVVLTVRPEDALPTRLGTGAGGLGWTTWLEGPGTGTGAPLSLLFPSLQHSEVA